jgi:Domain of unknown function (DUF4192)
MTTFDAFDFPLDSPGTLIAALPAVLGFVPEDSLVLVTIEDGELGCVMRADLPVELPAMADHLADVAAASGPDAAVVVIVDADGAACRMCGDELRLVVATLDALLDERSIALRGAYVVDRVAAGGRWHDVADEAVSGVVEDPMSSPLAAAAVLDGRRLYTRRTDLLDAIALADPAASDAMRPALLRAEHDGDQRPDADARRDVEHALAMVRSLAEGRLPAESELARLACGFADPRVRDTMYALAVGADAGDAEALWALLTRTLPDPWRVEALVLLAFSAYSRGDGPLAGICLEAALDADATHRMAGMLDQALQTGMRPEQIRELAQTGYRLAKRLGIELPPRHGIVRRRAG